MTPNQSLFNSSGVSLVGYKPGSKKVNQDCILTASIAAETVLQDANGALLVVCDGHGEEGESVSQYVARRLCAEIILGSYTSTAAPIGSEARSNDQGDATRRWNAVAASIARSLSNEERFKHLAYSSGTTCVAALLENHRRLTVANLGDSRCVVVARRRRPGAVLFETADHKPDAPKELERIRKANGHYTTRRNDVPRVAGLALSRAFGDLHAAPHGVISEMEVFTVDLNSEAMADEDVWIVLGSDGIFDMFETSDELGRFLVATEREIREEALRGASVSRRESVTQDERRGTTLGDDESFGGGDENLTRELCVRAASEARSRWLTAYRGQYVDDISIVIGSLRRSATARGKVSLGAKL